MNISIVAGSRIRTFGGWYRHDRVLVDGVELLGFVQVCRRNGRIESTTHFQYTSSAVLGCDVRWLYRQNKSHEAELLGKRLVSAPIPALENGPYAVDATHGPSLNARAKDAERCGS